MIKVLYVYARFHVYMYRNMCLDFANLFTVVIFSTFFCFCRSWYLIYLVSVRKILGLSLCELNNLLNIYLLGKVKTCIVWCKKVINSRVIFLISVQKKWLYIFLYDILLYLHKHSCVHIIWKLLYMVSIVCICNMEIPLLKVFVI